MENTDTQFNMEKIKYFLHLPAHVKRTVVSLEKIESAKETLCMPAYVVAGSITAIGGRLNIPDISTIARLYEINESFEFN